MTDYNFNNENRDMSEKPKVRRVDAIFSESDDTITADSEEARTDSAPRRNPDAARRMERPSSSQARRPVSSQNAARTSSARSGNRLASAQTRRPSAGNPQQQMRRPNSSSKKNSIKRKKRKFRKLYMMYIALLIVVLIVGSILFSSYLGSYENAQPAHVASSIVDSYGSQQGIIDFITQNADKTSVMGDINEIAQSYATSIAGKKISFIENSDYRESAPSYDITADGETVAKVTLGSVGKGSFGSTKWGVSSLEIANYLPGSMSVVIEVPSGASVSVNGTVLDSSYISSSSVPEVLANSVQFISDPPLADYYTIGGLLSDPEISVTDASGKALTITETTDGYSAFAADQEFIDSVEDRVYQAIENYATYFISMSYDLKYYIEYGSDLYSYIFGSDTMDPILTSLYNYEEIDHYDFAEESATNYMKYADDCFTVDIKYALDMYFTDPSMSDDNQKMDATFVFVIETDGSWCISDIINH